MGELYDWHTQLAQGEEGERKLDNYFKSWYNIRPASMEQQWSGIDRVFARNGKEILVEYKRDNKTRKTGNIFVETHSNVDLGRYGWAWTSKADILVYLEVPDTMYIVKPFVVRDHVEFWEKQYGLKDVENKGYQSRGIPVPKREFAKVCEQVRRLK